MDLNALVGAQLALGLIIVALNIRAGIYFYHLWSLSESEIHPERSWLLKALVIMAATIVVACSWFLVSIAVNTTLGTQLWLRPVNALIIIVILTVPIRLAREFRRREREARDRARVPEMDS